MSFNSGSEQLKEEERRQISAIVDAAARANDQALPGR
jgi:hypothetical protein